MVTVFYFIVFLSALIMTARFMIRNKSADSYVYCEIVQYLKAWDGKEKASKIVQVEDCFYQMEIRSVSYGKGYSKGLAGKDISHMPAGIGETL